LIDKMPRLKPMTHRSHAVTEATQRKAGDRVYAMIRARVGLAAVLLCCLAGGGVGHAQVAPKPSANAYNDELRQLKPPEQAAKLAEHLGLWCVGTRPFFMGETREGAARGYAYWSITCAGGNSYMIQITPDGVGAALDCRTLKAQGKGRECYKTF
jgi:hypothetical protein